MYIAYGNEWPNTRPLEIGSGLGIWLDQLTTIPNLDCNVSVWIVPGTVDPTT